MTSKYLRTLSGVPSGVGVRAEVVKLASATTRGATLLLESGSISSLSIKTGCKLAVSVLDLPEPEAGSKRRPLYGPIPWSWWLPASRLSAKSLQVGAVCWLLAGWNRSAEFELALADWAEFGLSRFSASRGLDTLERAGLVSDARRPGRSPVVLIRDPTAGARQTPFENEDRDELP